MKNNKARLQIQKFGFSALAAFLLLGGCSTNPQGRVYRDWATSFSQLGIYPIFPPREDVNAGDIYLLPMHPLNSYVIGRMGGLGMTGIHIGYADWDGTNGADVLAKDIASYYYSRPTFPDGPAGGPLASATNASPETNSPAAGSSTAHSISRNNGKTTATNSPSPGSQTTELKRTNSAAPTTKADSGSATSSTADGQQTNQPAKTVMQDVPILAKAPPDLRSNVFAPLEPVRLKEVAFPEFAFTKINEASAAGAVPVEGVLVNAGFDVSKVTQITVKIPVAESYGVPAGRLLRNFFINDLWQDTESNCWYVRATPSTNEFNVLTAPAGEMAREMFTRTLQTAVDDAYPAWPHWITHHRLQTRIDKDTNALYLALITEVYYTRSINMVVSGTSAFAGGASAAPVSPAQVQQWMGLAKASTNSSKTTTTTTTTNVNNNGTNSVATTTRTVLDSSGAAEDSDPFAVADKLRNMSLGYTNGIGGSVRILGVSAHNVALQRTFEHPIAVGVRGLVMRISAEAQLLPTNVVSFTGDTKDRPLRGYKIDLYHDLGLAKAVKR